MKRTVSLAAAAALLTACGGASSSDDRVPVTVLAAASLTGVFTELETAFEAAHPTADVRYSFGGSSDLAAQIVAGAPADVFASADQQQLAAVTGAGLTRGAPEPFATNVLTIAVPAGNPSGIASFADLARPGVTEVVCAPQVPCGAAAEEIEQSTGVTLSPASEESDVKSVLAKVAAGEADAGLVYVTDVAGSPDVESIPFPEADSAVNEYPIAAIVDGPAGELGRAFVEFVLGEEGQAALREAGFGTP